MNRRHANVTGPARQGGMSLLVVLILLVVMSVLGIAVLRSAAMQERMSANMYDRSLATQATEAALADAIAYLGDPARSGGNWDREVPDATSCAARGVCPTFTTQAQATWQPGPPYGDADPDVPDTTTQYWIEYLGENQSHRSTGGVRPASQISSLGPMYRITARSQAEGRASVTLQSDVIYRFPTL